MPGIKKNALNCTCSTRYFAQERLAANCFFVDILQELMINGKYCKKGKKIIPQNLRQVDYGTGAATCNINGEGKLLPIQLKRCYTVFSRRYSYFETKPHKDETPLHQEFRIRCRQGTFLS
jgi:hypothetical protein